MSGVLVVLALLIFDLLLCSLALWTAAKLLRYQRPSWLRSLTVVCLIFISGILLSIPQLFVSAPSAVMMALTGLVLQLAIVLLLIAWIHRTGMVRALGGVAFLVMAQILNLIIALTVVRPVLVEAYKIANLAMAPTLRGEYRVTACPHCAGTLLVPLPDPRFPLEPPRRPGLCAICRRHAEISATVPATPEATADRILVTRFLQPRRWDLLTHRMPDGSVFIQRVVAIPGETIAIDNDGKVLINGKDVGSPPDDPSRRFPWPRDFERFSNGSMRPGTALQLKPDEYFAIGDDSLYSYDSRYWGPVKAKNVIGVADAIYWPPRRVRILR